MPAMRNGGDRLWQITIACDSDILLPILRRDSGAADTRVSGKYFYHTDHLGSANWVTKDDEAVQFIHYMPYGEMWYNQRGSAYNERYKYTGKERDEETGYDYFGARHYTSAISGWLSPDPLMDKYPGISPYAYCNWNPAIVVLHSCSTGKGENSIAQQFSSDELFNNVIIVAPSMDVVVQGGKEYGPANKNDLENIGEWKMFLNGEVVNSFSGESTPIFDNPRQQVERYKNNVNE